MKCFDLGLTTQYLWQELSISKMSQTSLLCMFSWRIPVLSFVSCWSNAKGRNWEWWGGCMLAMSACLRCRLLCTLLSYFLGKTHPCVPFVVFLDLFHEFLILLKHCCLKLNHHLSLFLSLPLYLGNKLHGNIIWFVWLRIEVALIDKQSN